MIDIKLPSASRLLAAILFFLFVTTCLHAQYENGSVVGTIRDASGAAVPGAVVTITNNATGVTTKITANGAGDYEAPSLHVGAYTISASAPGFADVVAQSAGLGLAVAAIARKGEDGGSDHGPRGGAQKILLRGLALEPLHRGQNNK